MCFQMALAHAKYTMKWPGRINPVPTLIWTPHKFLEYLFHQIRNIENGVRDGNLSSLQGGNLALRGAGIAGDDGTCVPHTLSWRGGATGNEGYNRLGHPRFDELGGVLFVAATDLATHHDGLRPWVLLKELEVIDEGRADDGVAPDADATGLADTGLGKQRNDFVGECARARDEADRAGGKDLIRDNADLAVAGRADAGTIGADQARSMFAHEQHGTCHVDDGDTLGDTDNQFNARAGGFHDCVGGTGGRDEDATRIGICSGFGLRDGIEDRHAFDSLLALARGDAANDVGARRFHVACVIEALASGNALYDHTCVLIH